MESNALRYFCVTFALLFIYNIALLPKKVTNYVTYFLWKVMCYVNFVLLSRYFLYTILRYSLKK